MKLFGAVVVLSILMVGCIDGTSNGGSSARDVRDDFSAAVDFDCILTPEGFPSVFECGSSYELSFETSTNEWIATGPRLGREDGFTATFVGCILEQNCVNIWGAIFQYNAEGELFWRCIEVGSIEFR